MRQAGSETKMTTIRGSYDMGMAMIKVGKWTIEQSGIDWCESTACEVEGLFDLRRYASWWRHLWAQSSDLGDQDATVAATGVTAAIDQSGRNSFDIGYHMPMNANVTFFARYGEQRVNCLTSMELHRFYSKRLLMFGWQLIY